MVDCTGSSVGFATAIRFVKPRGTIVLKTTVASKLDLLLAPLVIDEITVVGSRCGPFTTAIDALQARRIQGSPLIQSTYRFDNALQAFDAASQIGAMKILLAMDETASSQYRLPCQ